MPPRTNQLAIYQEHKAIENKLKSLTASQVRSVAESVKKIANVKITSTKKNLIKQFMELHLGDYGGKKLFSLDASGMIQLPKERGESIRDVRKITNKQIADEFNVSRSIRLNFWFRFKFIFMITDIPFYFIVHYVFFK